MGDHGGPATGKKTGFKGYRSAGANGAAMRVGPVALANISRQQETARAVWRTAIVTASNHVHFLSGIGGRAHNACAPGDQ